MGEDFAYDLCDTLSAHQDAESAGTMPPFATSVIDYPGTEEGWPRASEPPLFNAAMLVPAPLKQKFEKFVTGGFSNFGSSRWSSCLQSLEVQEIKYSDSGIELAVAHVLKLCKTLP